MSDQEQNQWLELGLRAPLTPEQERSVAARLAAHPTEAAAHEEDLGLNELLRQLPDPPLASNFTARVLQAVERERPTGRAASSTRRWGWLGHLDWARAALAALVLVAGGLIAYRHHQARVRADVAQSVAAVSRVATVPTLEMLEHFEAINRLSQAPPIQDQDLLQAAR